LDIDPIPPEPDSREDIVSSSFTLEPENAKHVALLCGHLNTHLKLIEDRLRVSVSNRGNQIKIGGPSAACESAERLLKKLYSDVTKGIRLSPEMIHLQLQQADLELLQDQGATDESVLVKAIKTKRGTVKPRGHSQISYVKDIQRYDLNFGVGPAGTGKTYLAVACAVQALLEEDVKRILLVRPAVEAGERLGFLPGDLTQKVDPYLRPLYDALYEMLGFETVGKYIERNIIEVAPLAFMRGRTLNNAFIILDEAQNTTREQMKMFLTRLGFGSTAVITGDATQIDLPRGQPSGLVHATQVLDGVDGVSFTWFGKKDVVRHPLVQRVVNAYEEHDAIMGSNEAGRS
jgi:phosphate starvation-inducible PhoH-like protein